MGRRVTKEGREALAQCMAITDWSPVYEAEDIEKKVEIFNTHIQTALQICMPLQRKAITYDKPWMTGQIKGAIKSRQKIYQKHGKTKKWKKARNIVQWQIKQAKKKY